MDYRAWSSLAILGVATALGCADDNVDAAEVDGASVVVDAGGLASVSSELPCEVDAVVRARCQGCHAATPTLGAQFSLLTVSDFQASLASGATVAERALARIHDESSPMPPSGALSASELATLDGWLSGGTPGRAEGETCGGSVTTPDELPCVPTHHFYSHAEGDLDAEYDVPTGQNEYVHFWFRNPFTTNQQAIAWAPRIGNSDHVHHYILYRTDTAPAGVTDGSVTRGGGGSGEFVIGWAPGKGIDVMPDDVSVELARTDNEWFYLQVHYWNPQGVDGQTDMSGVDICVVDEPRENTAAVMTLGRIGIAPIEPRAEATWQSSCRPRFNAGEEELFIMGSGPHMHETGTSFATVIERADGTTEDLIRLDTWSFDEQVSYAHDPVVRIGRNDRLVTTCTYFNTHPNPVRFGEGTEDEMCFNFALVYPISALEMRNCTTIGF